MSEQTTDQGAREARYAEAIEDGLFRMHGLTSSCDHHEEARAVVAVADAEQAELRAEVERTKRGARELGRILHRTLRDALDASGRHDAIDEDGDGDWGVVWETLAELRPRAEAAEAELRAQRDALSVAEDTLRALREGIRALADEWESQVRYIPKSGSQVDEGIRAATRSDAAALRRLLAPWPAATTGEVCTAGHPGCDFGKFPAPVSSGEAGTGEVEEERLEAALDAQVSLLSAPDNWQARAEAAERELRARELHHFETEQENAAMRQGLAALAELAEVQEKFNDLLHDVRWLRSRMDDPNARLDFIAHDADQVLNKDGRKPYPLPSVTPTPAPVSSGEESVCGGSVHSFALGGSAPCARPRGHEGDHRPGFIIHETTLPAPVSSGEAGDRRGGALGWGRADQPPRQRRRIVRQDHARCIRGDVPPLPDAARPRGRSCGCPQRRGGRVMPGEQDEIGAPELIPLCAHHREAIFLLAQKDHVGDADSERAAAEMRRQCCGRVRARTATRRAATRAACSSTAEGSTPAPRATAGRTPTRSRPPRVWHSSPPPRWWHPPRPTRGARDGRTRNGMEGTLHRCVEVRTSRR
jgi:hypothetical protein